MKVTLTMSLNQSILISNIRRYLGKDLGWINDSVIDHNISFSKHSIP